MVLTYHRLVICKILLVTCISNDDITYDIIVIPLLVVEEKEIALK